MVVGLWAQEPSPHSPKTSDFGGGYESLRPEQQRLIDDWFRRFSGVVQKEVKPSEGYDNLPLSTKTTFAAVTHALLMTPLTTESGWTVAASALELVDKVDSAAGEVLGERGDRQFRIYVQMKPGAVELLEQSQEFKRAADNTVYHKGYPTCYRSKGAPSIQISLDRDHKRADIDVDYRSAKFPVALINGHLTASNSDVRAGSNDTRHNNQWAGLPNWWRNLLGLPLADASQVKMEGRVLAQEPRRKDAKPAEAVYDFLATWLVDEKPNESFGYFGDDAFMCQELGDLRTADRGMSKFVLVESMLAANKRLGKVSALRNVTEAAEVESERLRPISQPHSAEFAMYEVREDLAEQFNCANRLESAQISAKAARSRDFGKYVGAIFRIRGNPPGSVVATLWRKDQGYWRLISYEIDPQVGTNPAPNLGVNGLEGPELEVVDGDREMIKATSSFFGSWLVKKNVKKAMEYVAPEALNCVYLYRADDSGAHSPDDARALLRRGMERAATQIGPVRGLDDVMRPPVPHHRDIKIVKHRDSGVFTVVSIPESMAEAMRCDQRGPDGEPQFVGGPAAGYGTYYASGFTLHQGMAEPAVMWIVWSKGSGSWKAASYALMTP